MSGLAGRFLSRNPIKFEGSHWLLYSFSGSTDYLDPFGLCGCSEGKFRSKWECCRDSQRPGQISDPLSIAPGGYIYGRGICCDGRMVDCVYLDQHPAANRIARRFIEDCAQVHEGTHMGDSVPCSKECPDLSPFSYPDGMTDHRSECNALREHVECLFQKTRICMRIQASDVSEFVTELRRIQHKANLLCDRRFQPRPPRPNR
jgi:hypothetical protein